jgi:hypothetical protein
LSVIWIKDSNSFLRETSLCDGLPCAPARPNETSRAQILGRKAIANIQITTRQLKTALARQDDAFQCHDSERYAAAVAMAEDARSALAAVPVLTVAEILAKAKALDLVHAATLTSLSKGESALVASILRDVRRIANTTVGDSEVKRSG